MTSIQRTKKWPTTRASDCRCNGFIETGDACARNIDRTEAPPDKMRSKETKGKATITNMPETKRNIALSFALCPLVYVVVSCFSDDL